jgi:broad specificity phosphatase PhoE
MPVTIHLVRHAQGLHNLSRENEALHDPQLTDLGKQQCAELKAAFPHHDKLTRLFASPLRRTLSTCLLSFASETEGPGSKYPQVVAIPELQEVSDAPCDTGSDAGTLSREFTGLVDLSRLYDEWNLAPEWTTWATKLAATDSRAHKARLMLKEMLQFTGDDEHVAIVTHGAFVHFLTNDFYGVEPEKGE